MTQMNLGGVLFRLGERESGTARLEEAVAAFREALQESTRDRVPLQWATAQNNLGNALFRLGERESGSTRLVEAVAAYREALQENTRARVPLQWAGTQVGLGTCARSARRPGERDGAAGGGRRRLPRGLAGMDPRARRSIGPRAPAKGVALLLLAERRRDAKMASLAVQQIEAAFTAARDGGDVHAAAEFEAQLPKARALAQKLAKR